VIKNKEMKNKLLYILSLLPVVLYAQQSAQIEYKINFLDSEYLKKTAQSKNEFLENLIIESKEFLKETTFLLTINGNQSTFKVNQQIATKNTSLSKFAYALVNGDGLYYTNMADNEILHQMEAYGSRIILKTSYDDYNWTLTGESKKIDKYLCYKAILSQENKKITAWFSPDIPFRFGPAGYGNLPGLILELSFENDLSSIVYFASHLDFDKNKIQTIEKPNGGKVIGKLEYDKMGEKAKENLKKMRN
jgi:GLPGLI family protein